jgi:hypothetical protein
MMGIEEGEEVQAKGMHNIVKKNKNRKFPKSRGNYTHSGTGGFKNTEQTQQK